MDNSSEVSILPVIMSGGAGSRLWPLSRKAAPKQLLPLLSDKTMIQETVARLSGEMFLPPAFICNAAHAGAIREQMDAINTEMGAIIVEPVGRNTAPCGAVAALHAEALSQSLGRKVLALLLPADHHVKKPEAFRQAISQAVKAASSGHLVTFGITPDRPETGYGYIEAGGRIDEHAFEVKAFKEKPDLETAKTYLASGGYAWNAGIFMFAPEAMLAEMTLHASDIVETSRKSYEAGVKQDGVYHLDTEIFSQIKGRSIDYAVMEPTRKAAIVPADIGWTDIGSFLALYDELKDDDGQAFKGDILTHNVSGCLIQTDGPLVAAIGIEGLSIIVEDNKVLVMPLDQAQDVKKIVEALKTADRPDQL